MPKSDKMRTMIKRTMSVFLDMSPKDKELDIGGDGGGI
jgi:hypothetical protein